MFNGLDILTVMNASHFISVISEMIITFDMSATKG
jgi:hypothetical protein